MSKAPGTAAATAESLAHVENVKALFCKHPEDVISPIRSAAQALGWLEEILQIIVQESGAERINSVRVKSLAEAGAYIAYDIGNFADDAHETMLESLRLAGVVAAKEVRHD